MSFTAFALLMVPSSSVTTSGPIYKIDLLIERNGQPEEFQLITASEKEAMISTYATNMKDNLSIKILLESISESTVNIKYFVKEIEEDHDTLIGTSETKVEIGQKTRIPIGEFGDAHYEMIATVSVHKQTLSGH